MTEWKPSRFTNAQRYDAAYAILEKLKDTYGEELLAVAVEGSTAKRLDHAYSDLELQVVLDRKSYHRWHAFFYQGLFTGISYNSLERVREDAATIDYEWPVSGDGFSESEVLYDPGFLYHELRRINKHAVSEADFMALIYEALMDLYEHVYKIFTLRSDETIALHQEIASIGYWAAITVGLANRHQFPSAKRMVIESTQLADTPQDYGQLIGELYEGDATQATEKLWRAFTKWAEQKEITVKDDALHSI
ncbi:kanamycin nucleotidyltransferase C-terminal domain-containing protein [Thalassobacillus hwangdonensis]|uniref:Kanamycin nucleotidyltransferase C-terminal domain-containing protein n=1 Tax=Thalassobacillus hwangdonensis TaxID=546108 RepID=A0ABW3L2E5_9BACI